MTESVRIDFLYALDQMVLWQGQRYRIVWRRWHEGEVSRFATYGLVGLLHAAGQRVQEAYEADVGEAGEKGEQ